MNNVWSISKWRDWTTCPAMFAAKHISREWKDAPSPQMDRGRKVHKSLEDGIKYDLSLAQEDEPNLAAFEAVRALVVGLKSMAQVDVELKVGVDRSFTGVDFFRGKDLWVRTVFDVAARAPDQTLVIDWKTGRHKPDHMEDAMFYGAIAGELYGQPTTVQYLYLDYPEKSFGIEVKNSREVLEKWQAKFDTADNRIAAKALPATPCFACKWCGNVACQHNRNEENWE